jgi:hypothetical protein
MNNQWLCVNCQTQIDLDTHGRCSACGSDAVGWRGSGVSGLDEEGTLSLAANTMEAIELSWRAVSNRKGWKGFYSSRRLGREHVPEEGFSWLRGLVHLR